MIDGSREQKCQLAFELKSLRVIGKGSNFLDRSSTIFIVTTMPSYKLNLQRHLTVSEMFVWRSV